MTFFKNLPSNSLPTGKSFQSNATKFPHPRLHIAIKYPKAEPKKGTMKISPNKTLQLCKTLLHHQRYMFLLQLQLYVLLIIRVTLRRIQKPFRIKSTFRKFKHTILSKGYKESQFYKLYTVIVANEPYTDHLYWQESTLFLFTSVYFDTTVS